MMILCMRIIVVGIVIIMNLEMVSVMTNVILMIAYMILVIALKIYLIILIIVNAM